MPPAPGKRLIVIAFVFYGPMLLAAAFVRPPSLLAFPAGSAALLVQGIAVAIALGSAGAIVLGCRWVSRSTGWGRSLWMELAGLLRSLDSRSILILALLSAFGEELLFRGVALFYLGLWLQGALFGLFHFPVRRALLPWTGFAILMGIGLGALTVWCGSLWPAVLLHFCVNYFNLHDLTDAQPPDGSRGASPPASAP